MAVGDTAAGVARGKVLATGFIGPDAPREEDLYKCVHCGLCLNACPTYVETGLETESPRGRIALMKAVFEGRAGVEPGVTEHWDLCIQCRACEAACPSGVPYGRLIEQAQAQMRPRRRGVLGRFVAWLAYAQILPSPRRMRAVSAALRLYQRSGLRALVRASRVLRLVRPLAEAEASLPDLSRPAFRASGQVYPAQGETRYRVGLLSGCVMPIFHGPTMEAAVRVLTRNGCEVHVPAAQGCCGSLNLHGGDLDGGRAMARRNIDAFLDAGVDVVISASAGCGATMKESADLFRDDPAYAAKAARFGAMTRDITEFLASLPLDPPRAGTPGRVTYQDSCHLVHAQRLSAPPRALMAAVPGLELVEMEHSDRCCGAGGSYQITQREMSGQLRAHKLEEAAATGAATIATANPGCMVQFALGAREAGLDVRVCHVVDLLDEAYRREGA
ncbi:MAG: heterodisulfide reductase-related iron-sulfur binding cluster [Chloroflexota bacterium]|nr:heterodisulfide reductase-related iron-sulfur binding cluster [Chloroflexota bacterium]